MSGTTAKKADKMHYQGVKVFLRPRPLKNPHTDIIRYMTSKEIVVTGVTSKKFVFDEVFGQDVQQDYVYSTVVQPLVPAVLGGYNCTVFAYGQTGTGKTHTMTGGSLSPTADFAKDSSAGLIPRSAIAIFKELAKLDSKTEYTVRVSFIEIYNEELRDLLAVEELDLKIYDDVKNKGSVLINNLTEVTVCNPKDVYDLLKKGTEKRQTAATNLNRQSSRSHTVFTLSVHTRNIIDATGEDRLKMGKLYLVDLAGSENVGRSGATEARLREAGTINKSLLTLGKIITAIVQKSSYIPYRDSKLTRILQDSLGGKTKTCMIATVSPSANCMDETLSTLEYASLARSIKNCPQINEHVTNSQMIKDLKNEIDLLRKDLVASRVGDGFFVCRDNYNKMCEDLEETQRTIVEKHKSMVEKDRKIDELESYQQLKETELRELNESFELTKTTLAQIKFVKDYFKNREKELRSTANQLLNVAETSTANETILHKKINNAYDLSTTNFDLVAKTIPSFQQLHYDLLDKTDDCSNCLQNHLSVISNETDNIDENTTNLRNKCSVMSGDIRQYIDGVVTERLHHFTDNNCELFDAKTLDEIKILTTIDTCVNEKIELKTNQQTIMDSINSWQNHTQTIASNSINDASKMRLALAKMRKDIEQQQNDAEELNRVLSNCLDINQSKINRYAIQLNHLDVMDSMFDEQLSNINEETLIGNQHANMVSDLVTKQNQEYMEFIEKTINTTKKQNKAKTECRSKVNKLVSEAKVVHARHMDNAKKSYEEVVGKFSNFAKKLDDFNDDLVVFTRSARHIDDTIVICEGDMQTCLSLINELGSKSVESAIYLKENIQPIERKGDTPLRPKKIKKQYVKNILKKKLKTSLFNASVNVQDESDVSFCTSDVSLSDIYDLAEDPTENGPIENHNNDNNCDDNDDIDSGNIVG